MAWPNVPITLGYIYSTQADVTTWLAGRVGNPLQGLSADWTFQSPPPALGSIFNSVADFETAWFGTVTVAGASGNTALFNCFHPFTHLLVFAAGNSFDWEIFSVGDMQAFIESEATSSLQTPEEYLAANDGFHRSLTNINPLDPGYCFTYPCAGVRNAGQAGIFARQYFPASPDEGVGFNRDGDAVPTFFWNATPPMAVMFFNFPSDTIGYPPLHSISINQIGSKIIKARDV